MTTPNLTDAAQTTVDLLRQYDCPHLQQAATDLQAAIAAASACSCGDVAIDFTLPEFTPWKTRGRPAMDREWIVKAIRANGQLPASERQTQAELAADLGISVKTLTKAWREHSRKIPEIDA